MFKVILKLIMQGRFKDAWDLYVFLYKPERMARDFTDEDFEPYYPDMED